jgi:hypothetical protein
MQHQSIEEQDINTDREIDRMRTAGRTKRDRRTSIEMEICRHKCRDKQKGKVG